MGGLVIYHEFLYQLLAAENSFPTRSDYLAHDNSKPCK